MKLQHSEDSSIMFTQILIQLFHVFLTSHLPVASKLYGVIILFIFVLSCILFVSRFDPSLFFFIFFFSSSSFSFSLFFYFPFFFLFFLLIFFLSSSLFIFVFLFILHPTVFMFFNISTNFVFLVSPASFQCICSLFITT